MTRSYIWRRIAVPLLIGLLVVGLIGLLSSCNRIIWDGGYSQAEFQITLTGEDGRPLEWVELRVEDLEGHAYYHYPVTDYLPDRTPTSDQDGLLVFHHVSDAIEFSGRSHYLFGLFEVEDRKAPRYICRFLYQGAEVHRVDFSELDRWEGTWEDVPKVKRRWKPPTWPASQLLVKPDEEYDDWRARTFAFFDLNHNGKLEPEEAAAYHAATNYRAEEAAWAELRGELQEEEEEFPVVRKAVAVRVPGR